VTSDLGASALRIDAWGLAIVIRAVREGPEAWRPSALALPVEPDRVAVLVTSQASASLDLAGALRELMSGVLGGNTLGLRMLPLGVVGSVEAIDRWARMLAAGSGREIVVPHGRIGLAPDGTPTLAASAGESVEWAAWRPGAAEAIVEPVVPAEPTAGVPPPFEAAPVPFESAPVPPLPVAPPAAPAPLAVRNPPAAEDPPVVEDPSPAEVPCAGGARPVAEDPFLLPVALQRMWPGHDRAPWDLPTVGCDLAITPRGRILPVVAARHWRPGAPLPPPPVARRRAAVPVPVGGPDLVGTPTALGWTFVASPEAGGGSRSVLSVPAARVAPPEAWYAVEVELHAGLPKVDGRPVAPAGLARQIAACPGRYGRPVVLVTVGAPLGARMATALFGTLADALGVPVIASGGPIRVDPRGDLETLESFRRWEPRSGGAQREITDLGRNLRARPPRPTRLRPPRIRPPRVRPVPPAAGEPPASDPGPHPSEIPADLVALLARSWPVPPTVGGTADRGNPGDPVEGDLAGPDGDPVPEPVLALVPEPVASTAAGDPPRLAENPVSVPLADHGDHPVEETTAVTPSALTTPSESLPERGSGAVATSVEPAVWIGPRTMVPPRPALRAALGQLYDVCGRFATRLLAEQPGLRVGRDRNDLMAALTALRAYCLAERDFVNATLRSCPDSAAAGRVTTLATWMVRGLESCPSTLGPLFRPGSTPPALLEAYRPEMLLAEPGFLDAELDYVPRDGTTVEYVIWSLTARRLDRLTDDTNYSRQAAIALFPPNTRFEVLAVERPDLEAGAASRCRVLLRQLLPTDIPGGDAAQRILDRLRSAVDTTAADEPDQADAGSPDGADFWMFSGDQASVAAAQAAEKAQEHAERAGPGGAPVCATCSTYAPGLDSDGARYDPAVPPSAAPDNASTTPSRGAQR
jgi:hypothetical protein